MVVSRPNNSFNSFMDSQTKMAQSFNTWGQQTFASSFARRGIAASMFGGSPGRSALNALLPTMKAKSAGHVRELERMAARNPGNKKIQKALTQAKTPAAKMGRFGKIMRGAGAALSIAYIAESIFSTRGPMSEKLYQSGRTTASWAGFAVGSKVGAKAGMATGAMIGGTVGTIFGPVGTAVGTAVGAAIGGVAGFFAGGMGGGALAEALYDIPQRMVDRERSRRNLNWKNDQTAFMTQSAFTMRQQSLQAMNRGMVTARSMLGREGVMLHQ